MPRELLHSLAGDVRRLLVAGAGTAAGDEGLRRRAEALRLLGEKVPALGALAGAVARLNEGGGPALLDLLVLVRQAQAALAAPGADGAVARVARSGPWKTAAAAPDVYRVMDERSPERPRRRQALREATNPAALADLRLLQVVFGLCFHCDDPLFDALIERAVPAGEVFVTHDVWSVLKKDVGRAAGKLPLLCRKHPPLGVELCRLALDEDDLLLRRSAVSALGLIGEPAAALVPTLVGRLADTSKGGRALYAEALGKIGPAAKEAVPALAKALRDGSEYVRLAASEALGRIGPAAAGAVPALRAAENGGTGAELRRAAGLALGRIQAAQGSGDPLPPEPDAPARESEGDHRDLV
jgi:hypothetical protein